MKIDKSLPVLTFWYKKLPKVKKWHILGTCVPLLVLFYDRTRRLFLLLADERWVCNEPNAKEGKVKAKIIERERESALNS